MSPPLGLIGSRPPISISPFSMAFHDSPGSGQADVVDGEVLARGEAVVHLEAVDVVERDPGAVERVEHRTPHMRQHVGLVGAAVELLLQAESDGAVPPAVDPADRPRAGVVTQVGVADQDETGSAVGHLAAVEPPKPAFDDGIGVVIVGQRIGHCPAAGLCVGIAARVGEVELGDRAQVALVDAVAPVVLVGHPVEHVRPHELRVAALMVGPCGGAEMFGGGVARHRLLQFDPDDKGGAVRARSQIGDRRQRRDAARCAGGLVTRCGGVPQPVVDGGGHRAEMTLAGEHLPERVGDVHHADV